MTIAIAMSATMTDNRTNEVNKYAGFLARQNHQRDPWRGIGKKCLCGVVFDSDIDHALHQVDEILRAALVAAQGAAPQAEHDPYQIVRVLHEHQRDTSVMSRVKCVCGVTSEDRASHRLHQAELIAHREVAPVLPSSGVDEDKLAEVIQAAEYDYRNAEFVGDPVIGTLAHYQARAVAEWLKGQGNAARE